MVIMPAGRCGKSFERAVFWTLRSLSERCNAIGMEVVECGGQLGGVGGEDKADIGEESDKVGNMRNRGFKAVREGGLG